jgi:hypothetical protein
MGRKGTRTASILLFTRIQTTYKFKISLSKTTKDKMQRIKEALTPGHAEVTAV